MDTLVLHEALAGLGLGEIRYYDRIDSTNDEAMRWLEQGAPDLALVVADEQTAGRGRAGRRWFTPPGAALAFSLVLRRLPTAEQALASLTASGALAVSDALRLRFDLPVEVKWPNDVMIHRRKVAGILVELTWLGEQLQGAVLGIGVNVSRAAIPPSAELIYPVTCLEEESAMGVDRLKLLNTIVERFLRRREQMSGPEIFAEWEKQLAYRGEWIQIVSQAESLPGRILGLNSDGSLRLLLASGREESVYSGDIRLRSV
jgi:BirA family transcriptional regulator, biotin operon repressor / biotin---[acetyl-CoA-carboxylase] ligase